MLRAMKFSESGLECWPCQCVLVISWTYSSRGNYLWKISYPGNVTESREEGGGGCVGRESNPDWQYSRGDFLAKETGMSSDGSARQSHKHTSLYASIIPKKKKKKTRCWLQ